MLEIIQFHADLFVWGFSSSHSRSYFSLKLRPHITSREGLQIMPLALMSL